MNKHLSHFVERMDDVVASTADTGAIAGQAQQNLTALLRHPHFLEERHREPADDCYRQHVVHVHPEGKYSIVALVWRPGQATPIHDHRCWCVVGVVQGREAETRYHLHEQGGVRVLAVTGEGLYEAGSVCALVPPEENIHRVANAEPEGLTISVHVYGADIAALGTSINQTFEQALVDDPGHAEPLSWRAGSDQPTVT